MKYVKIIILALLITLIIANLHPPEKRIHHEVDIPYGLDHPQFFRMMGNLLGPPIVPGNKVTSLENGAEIFPEMLKAIRSAQRTITFESYIFWSGRVGDKFTEALSERARAGVKVYVLVDWVGSKYFKDEYVKRLKEAGVKVEFYHRLHWYNLSRLNNRTHRKILVVDGQVAFTGGVGISDEWDGHGDRPEIWRDSQFKVEGPAVAQMQGAFSDNALKIWPTVPHDEDFFPDQKNAGKAWAQVFKSSATEGSNSVRLMYLLAIAAAKTKIQLASAYFVPDDLAIEELVKAKKRGVKIEIIVPGPLTDAEIVRTVSKGLWEPLLKEGIEIYEFQPAKYHRKVMIIDDFFVSVGSTNFDDRSFRINDENNLNVYDEDFARLQDEVFEKDKKESRRVTYDEWLRRPWLERLEENFVYPLKNQL